MANPGNLKPFQPGQSGNPSGRPAIVKEWREKCQKFMTQQGGFEILMGIAQGKGDPKDQLKAIQFIADHAMGKAVQQIAGADDDFDKLKIIIQREPAAKVEQQSNKEYVDPRIVNMVSEAATENDE